MLRTVIMVVLSGAALLACGQGAAPKDDKGDKGEQAAAPDGVQAAAPTKAAEPAPAEPAKPAEPAVLSDKVDDPTFGLALLPSGDYEAGKLSSFAVSLEARGKYHINQEYPMSIELSGPEGISFAKPQLDRPDAAEFGETKARFDVPFTPAAAGEHTVQAKVKFAVCTPETCVPDERTLALAVAVK